MQSLPQKDSISVDIPLQSIFDAASQQGIEINRLTGAFFIAAGFILLVVTGLTAYILYRFRTGRAPAATRSPAGSWEVAMIGIPFLMVGGFLYYSIHTMQRVLPDAAGRTPDVIITAHQWWWEARYPGSGAVTANEIHLPVKKRLLLRLLSADVIHDWWIPAFGNKMDLVPNRENHLWLTIDKPGVYYGACSEFCGAQHAGMRLVVVVQPQEAFDKWQAHHAAPASPEAAALPGAALFMEQTCADCHRIAGTAANGTTGPDLTHVAGRQTLLTGLIRNDRAHLEAFLRNPQERKPGIYMPYLHLADSTVKALTAYLSQLE
ncbi:cytochrome c oxidase subunit II [Chitinophaga japonensis]|nr:cytochrome c oxidase subunit II [Chitinophaga japonensis]